MCLGGRSKRGGQGKKEELWEENLDVALLGEKSNLDVLFGWRENMVVVEGRGCRENMVVVEGRAGAPGGGPHLLLVVGDDAAQEVGVGVPERGHELGERLLVQLAHRAEHALLGLQPRRPERHGTAALPAGHLVQTHDPLHCTHTHTHTHT